VTKGKATRRFLTVLIVLALLLVGSLAAVNALLGEPPEGPAQQAVDIRIPKGLGASGVADLLDREGIIDGTFMFNLRARFDDRSSQIRAGTYRLNPGMSYDEILTVLTTVPEEAPTFTVTIPEGLTVDQTLKRIAQAKRSPFTVRQLRRALNGVATPEWVPGNLPEGAEVFEGLLFPDTYEVRRRARAREVIAELIARTQDILSGVESPEGVSNYELLIMGSLIEREARLRREQPKIASVIYNRLQQDMPLQIDATVLYALGEHRDRVLIEDLEVDSPWNTYQQQGLPPTPISGAGQAAITAAAQPASTDFLYYVVVDPDTGRHAFSASYQEFLDDKARAQGG
jgi:UPF0755 protein